MLEIILDRNVVITHFSGATGGNAILVQFVLKADQGRTASIDLVISFPHLKGGHEIYGREKSETGRSDLKLSHFFIF